MKFYSLAIAGAALLIQFESTTALAAGGSISGVIVQVASPIEAINIPGIGNVGNINLLSLPVLNSISFPLFGKGIPVLSGFGFSDGLTDLESLNVLQGLNLVQEVKIVPGP